MDMDQTFLPSDIIFNIVSRLPAKTVVQCKCVCKSWLELFETPVFVKKYLSKSTPGLIVSNYYSFKLFEFVDELEHHDLHYNLVMEFSKTTFTGPNPRGYIAILGSVNGLLLLCYFNPNTLYVCNPITREYIVLPCLGKDEYKLSIMDGFGVTYGFGVSVMSGLYKVIRILGGNEQHIESNILRFTKSKCCVYTLGKGGWKSIMPSPLYDYGNSRSVYFNGNLHWLLDGSKNESVNVISCFDLETEVFSSFSPLPLIGIPSMQGELIVFENCLSICEHTKSGKEIVIWLMKEYGNVKSWTKQFVVIIDSEIDSKSWTRCIVPLKVFKDGDIFLYWAYNLFLHYSKKTNIARKLYLFEPEQGRVFEACLHVPSFFSLGSLAMETVRKF